MQQDILEQFQQPQLVDDDLGLYRPLYIAMYHNPWTRSPHYNWRLFWGMFYLLLTVFILYNISIYFIQMLLEYEYVQRITASKLKTISQW